jgi:hypothetical protein
MNWADRPDWAQAKSAVVAAHLAPVCARLGRSQEELVQEQAEHGYGSMLFGMMFEDLASRGLPPDGRNLIDDYLQRRGWRESAAGRRYLQQLRGSALSLYEVIAVSPGRHCDLRDLVRGGEHVRVHEHLGTQNLVRWDRIAARVLKSEGRHIFSGGILPFTQEASQELLQAMNSARKKRVHTRGRPAGHEAAAQALPPQVLDRALLQEACPAFTQIWLRHTLEKLHAPLPNLVNRDGEALVFTESRFPFDKKDRNAIIERLEAAAEWERDPAGEPVWTWLAKNKPPGKPPAQGLSLQSFYNGERPVSGTLELKSGALTLTTNSLERTERGKASLMALLRELIGQPLTKMQTPEQLMAERETLPRPADAKGGAIDPAVAAGMVRDVLDQHYRRCLDEPIPALDGKTPRQCIRSKKGREQVIEWLKYLENHELHRAAEAGSEPYDFGWMWEELKLARPRG